MIKLIFSLTTLVLMGQSCCSKSNESRNLEVTAAPEPRLTDWIDPELRKHYAKINEYLYKDSLGEVYFKSIENYSGHLSMEDRLIAYIFMYNDKAIAAGDDRLCKIIDPSTFVQVNDTLFKDSRNLYDFNFNSSGGVLSILEK